MRKSLLLLLLAVIGITAQAQIPNGYYNDATGKTGQELRSALHDIIKGHTTISYQQIWSAFWTTDNKGNNVVWDMYSDGANYTYYYNGNDQCGEYEKEGDCFNREHSWPKSWFAGNEQTIPGRDLHHIFPTDGYVNAQRSNYPFGEVGSGATPFQNGSKLGNCKSALGYSGKVYEPIDEYKGDFARAYFYMSTRYYTEDSDWGTSGMTNKADLKDWAIAMLLRWSDNDPVSQKEIDRNNAVYGIQGNRNPFIDHPEYAHIIWEPGWTSVTYNITTASVSHGTISAPSTAVEGTMVTLSATPAQGYMLDSWTVYKTGDPSTTISVSSNGTFTMPAFNITVSANFMANNTYYTITPSSVQHGSISTSHNTAKSGTTVNLTATPSTGYALYAWYIYKTDDINTMVYTGQGSSFTMPAFNVTVKASFAPTSVGDYEKVTTTPTDWEGDYLMVCESQNVAFNGTVEGDWGRCSNVTITNHTIASNSTTDAYKVKISSQGNGYRFLFPSGKYMSWTGEKKFSEGTPGQAYSITPSNGNVSIKYGSYTLKYNHNNGSGGLRSYTSGQTEIQLYKKTSSITSTPTHTIQFNSNGGNGSTINQTVNEYEPTALAANAFQYPGHEFMGWNTAPEGTGTTYFDEAIVTLLDDLTLYAQWQPLFNINVATVQNGTVTASQSQALEGDLITLTATPATNYEFDYWTVTDANNNSVNVVEDQFEMPASNVTVSATFMYAPPFAQQYHLVTSTDQLVEGRTYLIVNSSAGKALSATSSNGNNRMSVDVSISGNTITNLNGAYELTLGGSTGAWTFFDAQWGTSGGYLYAGGGTGNNNYLKTQATLPDEGKWTISIDNNGNATIKTSVSSVARHTIMYNNGSSIFSCYASGQQAVQLYIRSKEYPHTTNETIATIFPFDKHTVASGTTLTVTGTVSCNDPSLLVIEDGGQLVHHNDGVKATFKKNITAYNNDSDGWYTIASPFTALDPEQVNTPTYDLFTYNESSSPEWRNYKNHQDVFPTSPSNGYLYAHNPTTTLRITGTLNNGDYSETVNLSYASSHESIRGCNLLGNPTAHDITFNKSSEVSDGYYYLNNSSTWIYNPDPTVPTGRGFFVKANAEGQTVTLNPSAKRGDEAMAFLQIDVDGERAYVKMAEGVSMPLIDFRGRHSNVYLNRDGKNYIMLVNDDHENIHLGYQPKPGQHRLNVKTNGLNLDYLHLIDHLTGNDIDLLATPSYTFESSKNDYTSRFQLVFSPKANDDIYGDSFVDGKTVIIDMTGRVVATDPSAKLAPGIYLIRTVNGNEVKIKKIFIN